jgi:hypothetical protein
MFVFGRSSNQPFDDQSSFLGVCHCQGPSYQSNGTLYLHPDLDAEFSSVKIAGCKV